MSTSPATTRPTTSPPAVERAEEAQAVRAAVARLPDAQRLALTLHYFEDLRYEDIADVMGVPINTVKSHIRRGKERLAVAPSLPRPIRGRWPEAV